MNETKYCAKYLFQYTVNHSKNLIDPMTDKILKQSRICGRFSNWRHWWHDTGIFCTRPRRYRTIIEKGELLTTILNDFKKVYCE